jgi:hypothetical protein
MFKKKVLDETKAVSQKWEYDLKEQYDGKKLEPATTESGIPLKWFYSPQDIEKIDFN